MSAAPSTLTEQLTVLARASAEQVERTVVDRTGSGGVCVTAPDPEAWFTEVPELRMQARADCHACPVRLACLERGLRLETTPYRGEWLPVLHGLLAGLEPDEREPLRDLRRDCHTPDDRVAAVPAVAAEMRKRGWPDPCGSETDGGVDDQASRHPHGQNDPGTRETLLADLQAEHYGSTPTHDADEQDIARELHTRARRVRDRHTTREEVMT